MSVEDRQHFVAAVEAAHGRRLRRYLSARLRYAAADVPDLVQEIFLRLLRVERPEAIRSPEAYLFTIAKHVLHQYRARRSAEPELADIMDVLAELDHFSGSGSRSSARGAATRGRNPRCTIEAAEEPSHVTMQRAYIAPL